jgi:hypothetical protein
MVELENSFFQIAAKMRKRHKLQFLKIVLNCSFVNIPHPDGKSKNAQHKLTLLCHIVIDAYISKFQKVVILTDIMS